MIHVLYHGPYCRDGFGAAYAAWLKYGNRAVYKPMQYGDPLPTFAPNDSVFMLDWSAPRKDMDALAGQLTVIDHHKSAQKACEGASYCIFDMAKSGARLAWEYFHPTKPLPPLLAYIEDRDLWRWALPYSREINLAIHQLRLDFDTWYFTIENWNCSTMQARGSAMLDYQHSLLEDISKFAYVQAGTVFVNASCLMSDLGEHLLAAFPQAQIACIFWQRADKTWQYSLRSRPEGPDVSEIAERWGGGGHRNAAGFEQQELVCPL